MSDLLGSEIKACKHIKYLRIVKYNLGIALGHTSLFAKKTPNWIKEIWIKIVRHTETATMMHCIAFLLESSVSMDIILSNEHGLKLNSHCVWKIQTTHTLLLDCKQNVRGGLWVQFVKAAFQRTCLSGWVNDPLHHVVLQKDSLSHPLS